MAADLTRFGGRLLQARLDRARELGRPLSQTAVAEIADVVPNAVSKWESGASPPDVATIEAIAAFLYVEPGWLAFGRGEIRTDTTPNARVKQDRPSASTKVSSKVSSADSKRRAKGA